MDWSKYPLEKLVFFVATLIPGSTALWVRQLAHPGFFPWFFALEFLGYRSKLALLLLIAFAIGYTLSRLLTYCLGMLGGAIGASISYTNPAAEAVAPWRDPRWRYALSCHLGSKAPEDIMFMTAQGYSWRLKMIEQMAEEDRSRATAALNMEKLKSDMNDSAWSQWYDHFHTIVIAEMSRDWTVQVRQGLDFNMKTAALYILISSIWVACLRHWWSLLPAALWTFFFILGEWADLKQFTNRWSTLSGQIKHLLEVKPVAAQGSLFGPQ